MNTLEFTKKGNIRSEKEMEGIYKKKVKARRERKKKTQQVREKNKKDEKLKREAQKTISATLEYSDSSVVFSEEEKKEKTSTSDFRNERRQRLVQKNKAKQESPPSLSKEEKADFRKYMARRKAHKKAKKKARQSARKAQTESGIIPRGNLDDGLHAFMDFLGIAVATPEIKQAFQFVNLAYQLYASPSKTYSFSILTTFLSFHNIDLSKGAALLETIKKTISSLEVRAKPVTESFCFSDFLDEGSRTIDLFLSSSLVDAVRKVVVLTITNDIFSDEHREAVFKVFTPLPTARMTVTSMIDVILKALATVTRFVEAVWRGDSISEAFFAADPLKAIIAQSRTLLNFVDRLYYGLPRDNRMCAKMFVQGATESLNELVKAKKRISPLSKNFSQLSELKIALETALEAVSAKLNRQTRPTPIGVVVAGPPGIGKSSVTNFVYQTHSFVKGRKFEYCHVFERVVTSQYWDGYSLGTPYIHYSEVGAADSNRLQRLGDPAVQELTSVIDSLPFCCDMSDVKDKGKIYCNAEMVVIDTNNESMNIDLLVQNPAAYRRRFLYINPHVKKEYRSSQGCALDATKCSDDSNYYDRWTFDVFTEEPQSVKESTRNYLLRSTDPDSDIYKLESVLKAYFTERIERGEREVLNKSKNYYEEEKIFTENGIIQRCYESFEQPCQALYEDYADYITYLSDQFMWIFSLFFAAVVSFFEYHVVFCLIELSPVNRTRVITFISFILWYYGHISLTLLFMFSCLVHINKYKLGTFVLKERLNTSIDRGSVYIRRTALEIKRLCCSLNGSVMQVSSPNTKYLAAAGVVTAGVAYLWTRSNKSKEKRAENGDIDELDAKFGCGNSYPRVRVKNQKIWNTVKLEPSIHRSDLEGLHKLVSRNARRVVVAIGEKNYKTYCLGLLSNIAIINRHSLGELKEPVTVSVSVKGGVSATDGYHSTIVSEEDVTGLTSDLVLIRLSGITFKDILVHFPKNLCDFSHATAHIGLSKVVASGLLPTLDVNDEIVGKITMTNVVTYDWEEHERGSCGLPVVAKRDVGSCIVGIHSAGVSTDSSSYAIAVSRPQIDKALLRMSDAIGCVYSEAGRTGLTMPHFKSPVRYEDLGSITYHGSIHDVSLRQKSRLTKTIFRQELQNIFFDSFSFVPKEKYVPPLMQPVGSGDGFLSPYNIAIRKMAVNKTPMVKKVVKATVDIVTDKLLSNLKDKDIPLLVPLTIKCAINGANNDPYIRRIDVNKAAGYGMAGKKCDYLIRHTEENGEIWDEPNSELLFEIKKIVSCYMKGVNYGPVYKATLKDEPRLLEKALSGNTRVFFASPFAHLIVSRMFLAPLYSLMVEFSSDFYCALGVDMHRQGHEIYERLKTFSDRICEGDYSGYDTSMPVDVALGVSEIICNILKAKGYTEEQMCIVRGILSDNVFPYVDFIGELITVPGLQPSGKYATAEDNSLKGLFLMVYVWQMSGRRGIDFFDQVLPCIYGDDMLAAVKDPYFGAITYSELVKKYVGMKFTASNKGDIKEEFIDVTSMTFLKRTFVYSSKLKRIVCPLSMDSIYKALEWRLPSILNEETQMEQTLSSMAYELFLHFSDDRYVFEQGMNNLFAILNDNFPGCTFCGVPSYDDIYSSLTLDPDFKLVMGGRRDITNSIQTESGVTGWDQVIDDDEDATSLIIFGRIMSENQWSANKLQLIEDQIGALSAEMKEVENHLQGLSDPMPGMNYRQIQQTLVYSNNAILKQNVDEYYSTLNHYTAISSSLDRLWAYLRRERSGRHVVTESGIVEENKVPDSATLGLHQNIAEIAGDQPDIEEKTTYEPLALGQRNDLNMNEFLSRPLAVTSFNVAVGSNVSYSVDLWDYFLSHPSVRSKLRNYAYLRANMNFRISVSATPFHYSKILVSYQPLAGFNENLKYLDGQLAGSSRFQALTYLSQSKWAKVIDVKSNSPLEMTVPFISPQPMMRLFNKTPLILPEAASFDDAVGFGKLYIQSINPVRSASATPSSISVFVYAFLDNVELGAPTGTVIDIGTESGMDERTIGPVENFATSASSIATSLSQVPIIGPYAKASGVVLDNMASLSSLFGFSVPTMDNEPLRVKNQPFQNGAQLIGYDTGKRLTLDPKQELSVDPRVVATDEDEMSLSYICRHESLLDSFIWDNNVAPLSSSIWMAPVNPGIVKRQSLGAGVAPYLVVPTPLAFAASFFDVWRGDIDIRFEINCSRYHRGKLAFYFEPNISQNVVIDTVLDMNKQYIKIVDIQETQDVSFKIKWAFPRAWAKIVDNSLLGDLGGVGFLGDQLFDFANGYIAVTPFTSLQSPDSSDISVNVYISSDNMQFNQLLDTKLPVTRPTTESGRLSPEVIDVMDLNVSTANTNHISEVHYGEVPTSFRSLLKRFVSPFPITSTEVQLSASGQYIYYSGQAIYPDASPKYDGITSTQPSIFCHLRYAYLGLKGGIRRRIGVTGDLDYRGGQLTRIKLDLPSTAVNTVITTPNTMSRMLSQMQGVLSFVPSTQGGIEFELPNYTNNLFGISFSDDPYPDTSIVENNLTRTFSAVLPVHPGPTKDWSTLTFVRVVDDLATAEDFSFMLFAGSPAYQYS